MPAPDRILELIERFRHVLANSDVDDAPAVLNEVNEGESTEDEIGDESDQNGLGTAMAEKGGVEGETAKRPRAVFNVNVTLDSSLDTEKLQKQLELLKRFGAI